MSRQSSILQAIRRINQLIAKYEDSSSLIQETCETLGKNLSYHNIWIALLDASGAVTATAHWDVGQSFDGFRKRLELRDFPSCMKFCLETEDLIVSTDPVVDCPDCPLSGEYVGRASLVQRLAFDAVTYGVLAASVPKGFATDPEEQKLFRELAGDLAFGLHKNQAAEQARRDRDRMYFVLEGARLGTWEWNLQTNETVFNETWATMLGYTLKDFPVTNIETWVALTHPDDLKKAQEFLAPCLAGEERDYSCELRMKHKEGHWVWVLDRGRVMTRDEQGRPLSMFGTHADLTEIKQTEQALRESEERFRSYIEQAPLGVFVADSQGRYVEVNPAAERITGYKAAQLTSMKIDDILPPQSLEAGWKHFQSVKETGLASGNQVDVVRADGSTGTWRVSASRLGPDRFLGFVEDITEQQEQQERIALLGQMLDQAPAAITVHDTDGNFLFSNRQNMLLHGYKNEKEFLSINLHSLDVPEDEALLVERFRKIAEEGEAYFEVRHFRKDGSTFPLAVLAKKIEWKGRPAILSIAADISERKHAEQEREKLQSLLAQAQKMESVGRLAGGVAHDFNNMLNVILGHTEMALEDLASTDPLNKNLRKIQEAADRSASLTRQLLAFARKQTVAPKILDLNETITSMLGMLERLIGEDIHLLWKPGAGLDPVCIDPGQIDQILANLVVNARDAIGHHQGKITIETGSACFDEAYCQDHDEFVSGEYALLAVSDNGCGMGKVTLSQLFEPFFTTKELGKGTGLGLATVYGIVRQNKGFINVYSEPGQGTTFRIYLPLHLAKALPAQEMALDKPRQRGHETILLVEDEPAILEMITTMLEREGYTVVPAITPGEAIRLAKEHHGNIHLLMSDVVMPEMNGRDLAKNILSLYPKIKCLFMSGYTANVIAHHGVLDHGVNFIQKPFSKGDLGLKVREMLEQD
jgi:PAS domain S-box-containing protein